MVGGSGFSGLRVRGSVFCVQGFAVRDLSFGVSDSGFVVSWFLRFWVRSFQGSGFQGFRGFGFGVFEVVGFGFGVSGFGVFWVLCSGFGVSR